MSIDELLSIHTKQWSDFELEECEKRKKKDENRMRKKTSWHYERVSKLQSY